MSTFRRLSGPPAEMPAENDKTTEIPCSDCHWCCIHRSHLFASQNWSVKQRNLFEVFWQKIQHYKFDCAGGKHLLGPCDQETFFAFSDMTRIRGLFWDRDVAYYIEEF